MTPLTSPKFFFQKSLPLASKIMDCLGGADGVALVNVLLEAAAEPIIGRAKIVNTQAIANCSIGNSYNRL
jgi:hypothetical protein